MQIRDIGGFILIPLVLLFAAWLINTFKLWSSLGNFTLPWLCTAVAVSVLILGTVCVVLECPPSAVPVTVARLVVGAVLAIFGVGMVVDLVSYGAPNDWIASVGEWLGFAIILVSIFALPGAKEAASA